MPRGIPRTLANASKSTGGSPLKLKSYTVATVPAAGASARQIVYVTNGAAGAPVVAFSDGTNWKRIDTLANISAV
jgi:hypothetical protein